VKCGAVFRKAVVLAFGVVLASALPPDSESCPNNLCRIVVRGHLGEMRWPDFVDYRTRLMSFYGPDYHFAWLSGDKPTSQALAMIALLKESDRKGLNAEDYDAGLWEERIGHLEDRSHFDVSLTVSMMRYLADLHFGKADPGFFHLDDRHRDFDLANFLRHKLKDSNDPEALIAAEVEPPFSGYKRTEKALVDYLEMTRQPEIFLSELKDPVAPGRQYVEIEQLKQRLRMLGDLSSDTLAPGKASLYRGPVIAAVKKFQARHGLEPDGWLGKSTIEQLNVPIAHRVLQLRLALERWRWVPHSFSHPPIVVNIPEFSLRVLDQDYETAFEMKVVVGSAYEHETPVFSADLTNITFRPYWNVPRSILEDEIGPQLTSDRSYLSTHRYEVVSGADKVVPIDKGLSDSVLQGLLAGRYRIRQIPGPENALGLVRFGIPNEHNVYLHGTPAQMLFAKTRRDYSHGCVRVERPVQLAEWCLRETGPWTSEAILAAMNGQKTFVVNLKSPIPVLLVYATAVVLKTGEVRFVSDIYHQDELLENRMARNYPSRKTNEP
jgi:murein L,D-transpeptidase YcbB/YkuD